MVKKANIGIIAVVLAFIVLIILLVNLSQRECNSNKDCSENAYCGSDYGCHAYPDEVLVRENNFLGASVIFGLSLIISVYIYKHGFPKFRKKTEE